MRDKLVLDLYQIGAIKLGEFTLKTGATSPVYIDLRQIISYPDILRAVSRIIWDTVSLCSFDLICGIPYTALPIATCIALENNLPMIMRRKEKKDYGTKQRIEGAYKAGQSCLLVEDVITSGNSVIETAIDLEAAGLVVYDVAVLLDRESNGKKNLMARNYIVHSVFTLSEVLRILAKSPLLNQKEYDIVQQLLNETHAS